MTPRAEPCEHLSGMRRVTARGLACEECLALGAEWNELRVCLSCGHVGCCEDSPHTHALAHFNSTGHPLIAPLDWGETWGWCYVHGRYVDLPPELQPRRRSALGIALSRLFRR
ncbi:MAG TPA: UBP-type zinc finger domain-containing protein [Casimicrobiaceae bacterium]|nr:UBP-type zinc finger domain-containing protein [Casimicrobiaceae bacterium]